MKSITTFLTAWIIMSTQALAEHFGTGKACYTHSQYNCFFSNLLPLQVIFLGLAAGAALWNYKRIQKLTNQRKAALAVVLITVFLGGSLAIQRFVLVSICAA